MDYPSETSMCAATPSPIDTPSNIFFFWGEGAAVHRLSETNNASEGSCPSSNCPSILTDKVRRIVHSKLKPFHFQSKTYYWSDSNYETHNPSNTNNPSLVWKPRAHFCYKWMSRPGLELDVRVSAFAFSQSMIYHMQELLSYVKIFQKNSLFHPEMILRDKKYTFINI